MNDHPTVEQSLHSIALSMINIHKELKDSRRIHKDTLRFMKAGRTERITITPLPRKRTVGEWLRDQLHGRRATLWA